MTETILVIGATGYLGRHLVSELHARGYRITALARNRERALGPGPFGSPALAGLVDEWVIGDVTNPAITDGICDDVDRVVSSLGVTRQKSDPWDIDFTANLAVLRDAERSAVRSFGYVSVLHSETGTSLTMRAKTAFAETASRSRIPTQIFKPSGYFSDLTDLLTMARAGMSLHLGTGETRLNPIHGADLAHFIVDRVPDAPGQWDVGGPDILTFRQVEELAFAAVGKKPHSVGVPAPVLRSAEWIADRMSPRVGNLTRFFSEGLVTDAVGLPTGTHRIADYFREQAAPASADSASDHHGPPSAPRASGADPVG
ncbi:SDR family oxidoreductase [Microbacterium panaciterrae]|uniref:Divinyl chlorophyllide a 8-vinyl-reductase, chloroplastic n=1 Tax=Microbacterium panaciterrae TaxID=985759 RepID=A0ABP8PL04_9MICO